MPIVKTVRTSRYTLMLGDCLERMKEIEPGSVDMVMTDPPYGTTQCKWDSVIPLEPMWKLLSGYKSPVLLFCTQPFTSLLVTSNLKEFKYCWIWKKNRGLGFLNAKKMPLRDTEDIAVFYKKPPVYNPQMREGQSYRRTNSPTKQKGTNGEYTQVATESEGRYPLTTLEFPKVENAKHPTQKPVALMEYLIKTYTNEGDLVLDFAMGSGTTGVACMNLNRRFIGIEIEPEYYLIAKERIANAYRP